MHKTETYTHLHSLIKNELNMSVSQKNWNDTGMIPKIPENDYRKMAMFCGWEPLFKPFIIVVMCVNLTLGDVQFNLGGVSPEAKESLDRWFLRYRGGASRSISV